MEDLYAIIERDKKGSSTPASNGTPAPQIGEELLKKDLSISGDLDMSDVSNNSTAGSSTPAQTTSESSPPVSSPASPPSSSSTSEEKDKEEGVKVKEEPKEEQPAKRVRTDLSPVTNKE